MYCICMCKGATWGIYHTSALAACRFGVKGNRPSLSIQHYAQISPTAIKPPLRSELPKYIQIHPNTIDSWLCVYTYMHFYKYTYIIIYIHIYICVSAGSAFDSGTQCWSKWSEWFYCFGVQKNIKELSRIAPKQIQRVPKQIEGIKILDKCFLVDGCNWMQPAWIVIII